MEYINRHPEKCRLMNMLEKLRSSADLRSRDLMSEDITRARAETSANAYAFCIMMIDTMEI